MKKKIEEYLDLLVDFEQRLNDTDNVDDKLFTEIDNIIKLVDDEINLNENPNTDYDLKVKVKKLKENAVIPTYSNDGDAGMDLTVCEIISEDSDTITYDFGLAFEIPYGYVGYVFPRSSIRKYDMLLTNSVGVIDCVPSGTKIKTVDGEINVEDLFENMNTPIISYNEELNSIEIDKVIDMWIVENKELLKITTEDGDIIELPYEKEAFTKSGWKKVKDLTKNDMILRYM